MDLATAIGFAATAVSISRSVPQLARILRTRNVTGLMPATPGCTAVSSVGWASYALTLGDPTLLTTSLVGVLSATALSILIARIGGVSQWNKRIIVLWGLLLAVIASIGGAPVLAGTLTAAVLVNSAPQVTAVLRNPDAQGVSVVAWLLGGAEGALWATYGTAAHDPRLVLWGFAVLLPATVVVSVLAPRRRSYRPSASRRRSHTSLIVGNGGTACHRIEIGT